MLVDEIREKFTEDVGYNINDNHLLHWHPNLPENRDKHYGLYNFLKEQFKDKRVLEIGYRWAGRFYHNAKVLDLYDPRPDIDYRVDICDAKVIPDESFDLISCVSVLEHIPKFWKAADEIQRILAKDGILVCAVPAVWPYHPFCGNQSMGGDYWRVTHEGLISLFDKLTKVTAYYVPAARTAEEPTTFGWGCCYVGVKNK